MSGYRMVVWLALTALFASVMLAQRSAVEPDLSRLAKDEGWSIRNRSASIIEEPGRKFVRLDEQPGSGFAWLGGFELADGTIEFDVRGKDVPQRSFVGISFRGVDDKTYDAVYFRPFNFRSEDAARRGHSVQYISEPAFTWQRLRSERPGSCENSIANAPDPNGWFHVRLVIRRPKVSVFVNDSEQPSLAVDELSERKSGLVGLWVGNNSSGDFSNLRIIPAE